MKVTVAAFSTLMVIALVACSSTGSHITVTRSATLSPSDGNVLMSADGGSHPAFATDLNGNVVWQYSGLNTHSGNYHPLPIQPLPNGNLIVVSAHGNGIAPCSDCGTNNIIQEIDNSGNVVWQLTNQQLQDKLSTAGYNVTLAQMSHDAIGLPNGHVMVLASNLKDVAGNGQLQGAVLIDLDVDHKPVWVWDAFDHLDVNRHPYFSLPDWIHGNAVIYSPDDGNLIFSSRAQSWLIKIDYRNGSGDGSVLWRLGYGGDFTLLGGNTADWFYAQHAPVFLTTNSTGVFQLGLFDNGNSRVMNTSGAMCGESGQPACYSTVPIFEIDETNRTARVLWRDTLPFFSSAVGNMQVLENGNVWFDAGRVSDNLAIMQEVTMETNPQIVLEMRANTIIYRAIHVSGAALGIH